MDNWNLKSAPIGLYVVVAFALILLAGMAYRGWVMSNYPASHYEKHVPHVKRKKGPPPTIWSTRFITEAIKADGWIRQHMPSSDFRECWEDADFRKTFKREWQVRQR